MRDAKKDAIGMAARRERLLEAGFRLMSARTIEAVTLQEIADEAKIGIATLYRYFKAKPDLVIEIGTNIWKRYYVEVEKEYARLNGPAMNAAEELEFFLDSIIDDVSGHTGAEVSRLIKLERLLDSGYSYGINVVVTSSDFMSVKERLYDFFSKFQNRIVFGVDGEDADRLIRGTQGQIENIRDNMAIFADGIHRPVVFKPFDARV